ncbi:MAG: hypothetical protein JWM53_6391 [bacterium]|nr:hypothetical protein [bacterium]
MRFLVVALAVSLWSPSADARPKKRAHRVAPVAAAAHVVPQDRAAKEHARAEAELADLRAGRVSEDAQPAEPAQQWAIQENDREVPAPLRQKK